MCGVDPGLNYFCNSKFLVIANYQDSNVDMEMKGLWWGTRRVQKMSSEPVSLGQVEHQEGKEETQWTGLGRKELGNQVLATGHRTT